MCALHTGAGRNCLLQERTSLGEVSAAVRATRPCCSTRIRVSCHCNANGGKSLDTVQRHGHGFTLQCHTGMRESFAGLVPTCRTARQPRGRPQTCNPKPAKASSLRIFPGGITPGSRKLTRQSHFNGWVHNSGTVCFLQLFGVNHGSLVCRYGSLRRIQAHPDPGTNSRTGRSTTIFSKTGAARNTHPIILARTESL